MRPDTCQTRFWLCCEGHPFHDDPWEDLLAHLRLFKVLSLLPRDTSPAVCLIPRVFAYVDRGNKTWWDKNQPLLPVSDEFPTPSVALLGQRIPPLPETLRNTLVDKYCPIELQEGVRSSSTNADCLARVCLGRRRAAWAPLSRNLTLRNFNLCLDQMLELGLPVSEYARAMAEVLDNRPLGGPGRWVRHRICSGRPC